MIPVVSQSTNALLRIVKQEKQEETSTYQLEIQSPSQRAILLQALPHKVLSFMLKRSMELSISIMFKSETFLPVIMMLFFYIQPQAR